jgi:ferredoxin
MVGYGSRGELLVCGPADRVRAACEALAALPHCTALVEPGPGLGDWRPPQAEVRLYRGTLESVTGHLGRFEAVVRAGELSGNPRQVDGKRFFDLVLDLAATPALAYERPPAGYYAPDAAALPEVLETLRGLVGEFEKPVYIRYAADRCARGASGITGCTRCAEVCPAWALEPGAESIQIDTHLCQGLGPCATVCPSGAIGYAYPERARLLRALQRGIAAYRAGAGTPPAVLFHGREWGEAQPAGWHDALPPQVVPFAVEEVGAVGSETWFAALAYGAARVWLLDEPSVTESVRHVLTDELRTASAILAGLGEAPESVALVAAGDMVTAAWPPVPGATAWAPAGFATDQEKRTTQLMALDHLAAGRGDALAPAVLPVGAAFGNLAFDGGKCTLCMACVAICPLQALHDGGDTPRLAFVEQNCVQCGLCVKACPEDALALEPRFLFDAARRRSQQVFKEEEPLRCISCGKPFATPSVINLMVEKLKGHAMFAGDKLERLKMCDDCRVRAIFNDSEAGPRARV